MIPSPLHRMCAVPLTVLGLLASGPALFAQSGVPSSMAVPNGPVPLGTSSLNASAEIPPPAFDYDSGIGTASVSIPLPESGPILPSAQVPSPQSHDEPGFFDGLFGGTGFLGGHDGLAYNGHLAPYEGGLTESVRRPFQSDHAFDGFAQPITNPINAKDPRSLTEARFLFVNNWGRTNTPVLGGGNFQVYALQLRLALTDRLNLFADKDGFTVINPVGGPIIDGWNNLSAGLKYTFIRDEKNQFLLTGGVQYEVPTGEADVFQNHGSGILGVFGVLGKEFGDRNHVIINVGNNIPIHEANSGYFYTQLHLDRQVTDWLTPLVEVNWLHYNSSGTFLPAIDLEGDGLINLGTAEVIDNNLVTLGVGFRAKLTKHAVLGAVYEFPLSSRDDLLGNRITADLILRY